MDVRGEHLAVAGLHARRASDLDVLAELGDQLDPLLLERLRRLAGPRPRRRRARAARTPGTPRCRTPARSRSRPRRSRRRLPLARARAPCPRWSRGRRACRPRRGPSRGAACCASSRLPPVSTRARLQSIIPAPVRSRSSLTECRRDLGHLTSLSARSRLGGSLGWRRLGRGGLGGCACGGLRPRPRAPPCGGLGLAFAAASAAAARSAAATHLLLGEHGLPASTPSAIARVTSAHDADRVVVAGNDEVGLVRVAVRVHERDDRDVAAARLAHGELLLASGR